MDMHVHSEGCIQRLLHACVGAADLHGIFRISNIIFYTCVHTRGRVIGLVLLFVIYAEVTRSQDLRPHSELCLLAT